MFRWVLSILIMVLPSMLLASNDVQARAPEYRGFETAPFAAKIETPTEKVPTNEWPHLMDDLNFTNMKLAIERQLKRFDQRSLSGEIRFGDDWYPQTKVKESLKRFLAMVKFYGACTKSLRSQASCLNQFNANMKREFNLYRPALKQGDPRFGEKEDTFFTAYYTPTIGVSTFPTKKYKYPIYAKPVEDDLRFKTRVEIDFDKALAGKGYELFYADNLFELYLLQVQGGGKVVFVENGKIHKAYISYDGTNKKSWKFISLYMYDKGYIDDKSINSQREFLENNPHMQREIYNTCPSYVYFKETQTPPLGSDMVPLTDYRSIATDRKLYPLKGALAFVIAKRPVNEGTTVMKEFRRFFLDQDTGGAIKGKGRVDLYHGESAYAEHAAYNTANTGNLFFLISK